MGPEALAQVLRPLILHSAPPALLVGLHAADDAAVYKVNEQQAIISTADFFPPVVDDPYAFGAIAAANAMSDVYAMGGQVLMAINLVAWPADLDPGILSEILRGGADAVARAGTVIAGGHTVTDQEPKYGLAVTGMVHPDHILTKGGAKPGDYLILSKPLGTGLITTAHRNEAVEEGDLATALESMMQLNNRASQALQRSGVHAVTDITGFGLLGHAWEMASQSRTGMRFHYDALPVLPNARRYAEEGHMTGGARRNEKYLTPHVALYKELDSFDREILWDPQTSGGLFAAIDPAVWPELAALAPDVTFWRIGEVTEQVSEEAQVRLEVD
ncbi:MAG TPA: selenide, water dikinase SelD [Ktedonobacteraceae bacterium]|nr:selenide, water dikinase SelD [Ktedonobacteraceae bacterium]